MTAPSKSLPDQIVPARSRRRSSQQSPSGRKTRDTAPHRRQNIPQIKHPSTANQALGRNQIAITRPSQNSTKPNSP